MRHAEFLKGKHSFLDIVKFDNSDSLRIYLLPKLSARRFLLIEEERNYFDINTGSM